MHDQDRCRWITWHHSGSVRGSNYKWQILECVLLQHDELSSVTVASLCFTLQSVQLIISEKRIETCNNLECLTINLYWFKSINFGFEVYTSVMPYISLRTLLRLQGGWKITKRWKSARNSLLIVISY